MLCCTKIGELAHDLHGARVCRLAPSISHLLFADDRFLFCKATLVEANKLKEILLCYENASGQALKFGKSAIAFSHNSTPDIIDAISTCPGVTNNIISSNYLGFPSMIGRNKKSIFNYIKDIIWKKCQSWSAN